MNFKKTSKKGVFTPLNATIFLIQSIQIQAKTTHKGRLCMKLLITLFALLAFSTTVYPMEEVRSHSELDLNVKATTTDVLVVMIGTDWCSYCVKLTKNSITPIENSPMSQFVSFTKMNGDYIRRVSADALHPGMLAAVYPTTYVLTRSHTLRGPMYDFSSRTEGYISRNKLERLIREAVHNRLNSDYSIPRK